MGREDGNPDWTQIQALTRALLQKSGCAVIDLGNNSGRAIYPLLEQASHIVICLRPERAALRATRQLVDTFGRVLSQPDKVHALMLDYGTVDTLPRREVETYLGFPLLDMVDVRPQDIAEAVDEGVPLVQLRPYSPLPQLFYQLTHQFAPPDR
jgi:Flp pilus assembly CpaE family ATPase